MLCICFKFGFENTERGGHSVDNKSTGKIVQTPKCEMCLSMVLLLIGFSAYGGIRTSSKLPVLTAYFPVLA